MATISDLLPSISSLPHHAALSLIEGIRRSRQVVKKSSRTKAPKAEGSARQARTVRKPQSLKDVVGGMTPEMKAKLLEKLMGGKV